jgi:hypothetical protein
MVGWLFLEGKWIENILVREKNGIRGGVSSPPFHPWQVKLSRSKGT